MRRNPGLSREGWCYRDWSVCMPFCRLSGVVRTSRKDTYTDQDQKYSARKKGFHRKNVRELF